MLLIEGLRSLQRPTYLQTPIGGHHHQLRSLDLVGQLTRSIQSWQNVLLTICLIRNRPDKMSGADPSSPDKMSLLGPDNMSKKHLTICLPDKTSADLWLVSEWFSPWIGAFEMTDGSPKRYDCSGWFVYAMRLNFVIWVPRYILRAQRA